MENDIRPGCDKIVDAIYFGLGELNGLRKRRGENERYVETRISIPNICLSNNDLVIFSLQWETGHKIHINHCNPTFEEDRLATINMVEFEYIARSRELAQMITSILLGYLGVLAMAKGE